MALTKAQLTALDNDIAEQTDPTFVALRTANNEQGMANWYNVPSTVDAWNNNADRITLFEGMVIARYIALVAGNRDAYDQMLFGGVDFTRNKLRNALVDIWGITDSIPVLQNMLIKATRGEEAIGGTVRVTNTVSALSLSFYGDITAQDISDALRS